jgi:ribosomal protein S18 acetylase RimI-like enzyme
MVLEHTGLVAQDEGSIIGTLFLNTTNPAFGFVFGVYVVPAARRRGVAEALMREAARMLRAQGMQYLVLGVDTENHAARALYEKLGFVDQSRTLRADVEQLL